MFQVNGAGRQHAVALSRQRRDGALLVHRFLARLIPPALSKHISTDPARVQTDRADIPHSTIFRN
jgi:hypothetical protein